MAEAHIVAFWQVKEGNPDCDWEDGAGYAQDRTGSSACCIVVDGATEAFDTRRWVGQLVDSFLRSPPAGPATLDAAGLDEWFGRMQRVWADDPPPRTGGPYALYEDRKAQAGSFATLLGCWLEGLDSARPRWTAAALGDSVLFHVRRGDLLEYFPPLAPAEFGLAPPGVSTLPAQRARMRAGVRVATRNLIVGDRLFLATDALAAWMVNTGTAVSSALWNALDALDHPDMFGRLVADRRAAGELTNDDVTLLRVVIAPDSPDALVVVS